MSLPDVAAAAAASDGEREREHGSCQVEIYTIRWNNGNIHYDNIYQLIELLNMTLGSYLASNSSKVGRTQCSSL